MRKMKNSGIEWIGEIPEEWNVYRNKNIFHSKKQIVGKNWKNYNLLSLTTKGIIFKDINSNSGKLPDSFEQYQEVNKYDLVMCLFDLDISAVFSDVSKYNGMITSAYNVFSCKDGFISAYMKYWFDMIFVNRKYRIYSKNVRYSVTETNFGFISTPVPPQNEQEKIANYLDNKTKLIDKTIELTKKQIDKLKEYKQALITETVTKGLDKNVKMKDSGVEWIGEIPEDWEVRKFKTLLRNALQYGANETGIPYDETLPRYIRITDIISNNNLKSKVEEIQSLSFDKAEPFILREGDVLFARSGATVGKTYLYEKNVGLSCFAGYLIRATTNSFLNSKFLYFYTLSYSYNNWKSSIAMQATIENIGADKYKELLIVLPPVSEQKIINDILDTKTTEIENVISQKEKLIIKLEEYKKSLIYECVTGKKEII